MAQFDLVWIDDQPEFVSPCIRKISRSESLSAFIGGGESPRTLILDHPDDLFDLMHSDPHASIRWLFMDLWLYDGECSIEYVRSLRRFHSIRNIGIVSVSKIDNESNRDDAISETELLVHGADFFLNKSLFLETGDAGSLIASKLQSGLIQRQVLDKVMLQRVSRHGEAAHGTYDENGYAEALIGSIDASTNSWAINKARSLLTPINQYNDLLDDLERNYRRLGKMTNQNPEREDRFALQPIEQPRFFGLNVADPWPHAEKPERHQVSTSVVVYLAFLLTAVFCGTVLFGLLVGSGPFIAKIILFSGLLTSTVALVLIRNFILDR